MQPADVAIIGLACRFPAVANPGDFWRIIRDGLEVTQLPGENARASRPREGLLDNVADFDADFFNLSPHEAWDHVSPDDRDHLQDFFASIVRKQFDWALSTEQGMRRRQP